MSLDVDLHQVGVRQLGQHVHDGNLDPLPLARDGVLPGREARYPRPGARERLDEAPLL
jgi:hypothetical protein